MSEKRIHYITADEITFEKQSEGIDSNKLGPSTKQVVDGLAERIEALERRVAELEKR